MRPSLPYKPMPCVRQMLDGLKDKVVAAARAQVGQRHVWCGVAVASRYLTPFVALAS